MDKDGYLDYGEFVAISIHLRKISHDDHLHRAFQFFDKNESGYIELEELRNALADEIDKNSEEVINAIMHDVDTDKVSIFHLWSEFSMNACLCLISHLITFCIFEIPPTYRSFLLMFHLSILGNGNHSDIFLGKIVGWKNKL